MMDKKLQAFMFLLFLSGAAFAGTFSRSFIVDYQTLPAPAYANTDISVAPSLLPTTVTQCTGSTFIPTLSLSTAYVVPSYEGHLSNDVLVGSYASCLIPYTTLLQNQAVNWVTNAQYSSLAGTNWYSSPATFQNVVPGMLQSDERSQYMNPLTGLPFVVNGDDRFKARIGLFCTASVELVSSTNPSIYQLITSQYLTGQSLTATPITLPSSPSTVQLAQRVNVTHCIASGRTVLNPSCASYETVWMYHNNTFPTSVTSTPTIITVKNPFSCNLVQFTNPSLTPITVQPGQQMAFSFVITNPTNNGEPAKITTVSASWAYSQPTVNGGLPQTIANNGVPYTITGTLNAPPTPGTYNFNLVVNYSSATADCSGATKYCTHSFPFSVTVQQPPANSTPTSCTLAFQNHGTVFTAPDSAMAVATCRNATNAVLPCGYLAWSTTASGGTMSPSSTVTPPQQSQSTFSITAVSAPQSAQVKAQQGSNFSCTIAISIIAPDYTPILSAPSQVQINTAFTANITTKNIGAAANISTYTKLRFRSLTQTFSVAPLGQQGTQNDSYSFTCPSTPGLYELNATVDANGQLTESNENNNFATQTVNCTQNSPPPPILKPNYVPNISAPSAVFVGQAFSANFTTKNIGSAAATVNSTTRATFQSTVKDFTVVPLAVQQQQIDTWDFPCTSAGVKNMVETVDYTNVINESNENDNTQTWPITCYAAPTSCTLAFVGHSSTLIPYDSALVQATCLAGSAPTACPPFLWQQNAVGGSMAPTNTPAGVSPSSTLSTFAAPSPQTGRKVNATSTLASYPLYCELPFIVSDGTPIGVDYNLTSLRADLPSALIGQTVHFTTKVTNIGNVNATNASTTVATYSPGCTPVKSSYPLPALNVGQTDTDATLACTCAATGQQSIMVDANPSHAQSETTYANNQKSLTFICRSVAQQTCSDFI